jgi:hypothetical protein
MPNKKEKNIGQFALAGCVGGAAYYLAGSLRFGGFGADVFTMLIVAAIGSLGGLFPQLMERVIGNDVPFLCSWTMVAILIFAPLLFFYGYGYSGQFMFRLFTAFFYGYLFSLLWKARCEGALRDI